MDLFTSMNVFTHVVEAHGFTAASSRLGLSRAAVSKHIAQLESHLGGQLLQRTTRRVSLTEIGQAYYDSDDKDKVSKAVPVLRMVLEMENAPSRAEASYLLKAMDTVILVISEFGRRTYENGSAGTDHGTVSPGW